MDSTLLLGSTGHYALSTQADFWTHELPRFCYTIDCKNGRFCKIVLKRVIIDLSCLSGMFVLYVGYVVCDQTRPDKSIETTPIIDKLLTSFSLKVLAVTI